MTYPQNDYRPAAWMMHISGIAHLIAPFVSGFSPDSWLLVPAGVFWIGMGVTMIRRGSRRLAKLLFVLALGGAIAGLDMGLGNWPVAPWVGWVIALSDAGAAAFLFAVLWRSETTSAG